MGAGGESFFFIIACYRRSRHPGFAITSGLMIVIEAVSTPHTEFFSS
jgi:hypothetical protein